MHDTEDFFSGIDVSSDIKSCREYVIVEELLKLVSILELSILDLSRYLIYLVKSKALIMNKGRHQKLFQQILDHYLNLALVFHSIDSHVFQKYSYLFVSLLTHFLLNFLEGFEFYFFH